MHTNNRLRGTHRVLSPELSEGKKLTEFGIRPISEFSTGEPSTHLNPTPNPSPTDTTEPRPLRKLPPPKTTPQFLPDDRGQKVAPKNKIWERKISPKFFRPKFYRGRPRGMSVPKCLLFQDLEGLTEVFGRMSAGTSGRKLPLWADFSFLNGPDMDFRGSFLLFLYFQAIVWAIYCLSSWGRLFCLQLEASCLQWSFLLTVDNFSILTYTWSFFAYSFSFFTYSWSFLLTVGKCV